MALVAVLTDRVASARSLSDILAWRLCRLLRQPRPQKTQPEEPARPPATHPRPSTVEEPEDWHQHRATVRALGGPAAVRAALAATGARMHH